LRCRQGCNLHAPMRVHVLTGSEARACTKCACMCARSQWTHIVVHADVPGARTGTRTKKKCAASTCITLLRACMYHFYGTSARTKKWYMHEHLVRAHACTTFCGTCIAHAHAACTIFWSPPNF
jgi:hypothetical protein